MGGQTIRPPTTCALARLRVLQPPPTSDAHAGRSRLQTRTPHSMKAFEVKRRSEQGPFGKDVVVAPKQEPSGAVTFFEETEDRFDKGFATPIMGLSPICGHQASVALQKRFVDADLDRAALVALGALAECWAGAADLASGFVASEDVAVVVRERALVTQYLALRAKVSVVSDW